MEKTKMLKKNYEYRNVLSRGKYFSGKNIEAFVFKNNSRDNMNFIGIAIGVKIAKAVERNRIKRLIRENYRRLESNINTGYSIVFLCKKKAILEDVNFHSVEDDLIKILKKSKILVENNEKNIN